MRSAEALGGKILATEPRAVAAHYDSATGRIVLDLINGCTYTFPSRLVHDLQDASAKGLTRVEVDGRVFNLHWPSLDVDLYVPGLVAGIFGTRAWMAQGPKRSAPKASGAAAARGTRAGRSRRLTHA
ncbi:MAG TPA: DUF2442 domain-containing protein [Acetobacteraceae bacterium]